MTIPESNGWARNVLDADPTLTAYEESMPVKLIATARCDFMTCTTDEEIRHVLARNRNDQFDHIPVIRRSSDHRESIVGVLHAASIRDQGATSGTVGVQMEALCEDHLLGADASILSFVRQADTSPFRLVVSRGQIAGLVSITDLQRLPVRAALFGIVTHLELVMAEAIRRRFRADDWLAVLPDVRRTKTRELLEKARSADTLVDEVLYTQFCDKVTIIKKLLGPVDNTWSKSTFQRDMTDIQNLRDNLAHANNYAATREAARNACHCVRKIDLWTRLIAEWVQANRPGQAKE